MSVIRAAVLASLSVVILAGGAWAMEKPVEGDAPSPPDPKTAQRPPTIETGASATEAWREVVANLSPGYWQETPLPVEGKAMYYNPGVMERVLAFRKRVRHVTECDVCIGYVALLRAGDLDRRVWLQRPGQPAEGPFWVIDAAGRSDIPHLLEREWVVDVDYETARRWGMAGPVPVRVLAAPPEAQPTAPVEAFAGPPPPPLRGHLP